MKSKKTTGQILRDKGITRVLNNTQEAWRSQTMAQIKKIAAKGIAFNFDDIYEKVGPPPGHPNAIGALMNSAVKSGLIKPTNQFRHAQRPASHHRLVRTYVGCNPSIKNR